MESVEEKESFKEINLKISKNRFTSLSFPHELEKARFLPILPGELTAALNAAEALQRFGVAAAEVPLRSEHAVSIIGILKNKFPQLSVVAGTVLQEKQATAAVDAGACALVSPGFDETILKVADKYCLHYFPGVFTASEVQNALNCGCRWLKFFPAAAVGVEYLRALAAPFASAGVHFMPTGGINEENYRLFLEIPSVFCVAGSDMEAILRKEISE